MPAPYFRKVSRSTSWAVHADHLPLGLLNALTIRLVGVSEAARIKYGESPEVVLLALGKEVAPCGFEEQTKIAGFRNSVQRIHRGGVEGTRVEVVDEINPTPPFLGDERGSLILMEAPFENVQLAEACRLKVS